MYSRKYIDNLFINLKLLGKITTQGRKLYTQGEYLKLDEGKNYKQTISRWWYNEDRVDTLDKIKEIIRESIDFGQSAIYSEILLRECNSDAVDDKIRKWVTDNMGFLKSLVSEMEKAIVGIKTLQDTYSDDSTLCSKLELEIELMEINISKFKEFLKIN